MDAADGSLNPTLKAYYSSTFNPGLGNAVSGVEKAGGVLCAVGLITAVVCYSAAWQLPVAKYIGAGIALSSSAMAAGAVLETLTNHP